MIKLNNKNITYVALADSNNSLKAPKEIWYADSSNSVKLVYRRKDALIEGIDYEKYHWLVGDGSSYIDVQGYSRNENWEIVTKLRQRNIDTWVFLYGVGMVGNSYDDGVWTAFGGTAAERVAVRVSNGTTHRDYYLYNTTENQEIQVIDNHSSVVFNGNVISVADTPNRTYKQCNEFYIFSQYYTNRDTPLRIADADFSDFLVNESGINILNLIPCKLLKPVPKWLDANSIRRQVGECGMIDLVSGKFYGNVNSVGTFTVENYYERKEWLVGDGEAYIDTLITDLSVSDYIKTIFDDSGNIGVVGRTWGREGNRLVVGNDGSSTSLKVWGTSSSFVYNNNGTYIYDMYFDLLNNKVTINNQIFTLSLPHDNGINFLLFARHFNTSPSRVDSINCAKFKSFEIHNQINLIPCTLTMDLPASMDANNIARTKGTSGMWDLVSDKFYGNVASSGTFKAVNLAEGVDYEVHQWLIRTGGAYISIPINLWQNRFDMCIQAIESYTYFNTYSETNPNGRCFMTYNSGGGNQYVLIAFRESGSSHITDLRFSQALPSNTISIFQKDGIATGIINGVEYQDAELVESSWNYDIECQVPLGKTQYFKVYNGDGTYRSNLIPVKLLRSIPSKYDANGIARQAGECGMYDTVNDVFYGNVASSGSFTVEDDN